mgnify:CR=1 FL=1
MTGKKNWFVRLAVALFEIFAAYALFSGILHMAGLQPYQFLWYGVIFCGLAAAWIVVHIASGFMARWKPAILQPNKERQAIVIERAIVAFVIVASAILRVWVITKLPIAPSSDYQTYYQVADLLSAGNLCSLGYIVYIA